MRIDHAFNYGLSAKEEDHVHRIGRAGSAGTSGTAESQGNQILSLKKEASN